MRSRVLPFLLALAVSACAIGPRHRVPAVALRPAFREARDTLIISSGDTLAAPFWTFGDDAVLGGLVEQALAGTPDIRAAEARVRAARARRLDATLDFAPTVTAEGSYQRRRVASATFGGAFTLPDQDVWDVGVAASWELDLFGRVRRNAQGERALVAAAQEDVRGARVTLAADIATNYYLLRGAQERREVARRNAENQQRTLQLVQELLDAGRGTAFDVQRATAQLRQTLATLHDFDAAEADARYRIAVLLGRPPAEPLPALDATGPLPQLPDSLVVSDPATLVRSRPDVASAERQLAARTAFVGAAQAEYLPRVTASGTYGYTSLDLDVLGRAGTQRFTVGPVISWPFLNLGRVKAGVESARGAEDEARANYERTVLGALRESESALADYRAARGRAVDYAAAAEASEKAASLARLRFQEGVANFLEVLDAQRSELASADQAVGARLDAAVARVAVYRALGGTWPLPAGPEARR